MIQCGSTVSRYPDMLRANGAAFLYLHEIPMINEDHLCSRFSHSYLDSGSAFGLRLTGPE
ncbi:hypothetical protein LP7551_02165 [Roseibium album]|nr:hypothetical protein LP7551_02165 [Roseibium album]